MVFDYKKEYKDLYFLKKKPELITVPEMNYLAVSGSGDPIDIKNPRYHHEIYLGDPRGTRVERLKTVIRLPIK